MSSKVAAFVSRLAVHFPPPKFDGPEQESEWLRSIIESLKGYSDDVLTRAAQHIIDTRGLKREEKWFPVPAEIRRYCNEIIAEDERLPLLKAQQSEAFDGLKAPPFSKARTRLVLDLLKGEMGRRAAREMWIGSLVDYVRYAKALPDEQMVRTIKSRALEFQDVRERCHAGVGWPDAPDGRAMARRFAILADTMERNSRRWARVILGHEDEEALFRAIPSDVEVAA